MRTLVLLTVLTLVSVLAGAVPAWADPPGGETVAEYRKWLAYVEETYDARMARALSTYYAHGVVTQRFLLATCLRSQTVGELSAWLRTMAPPDITLLQASRLNARERGCEARDQADADAELAIRAGPAGQRP